MVRHILGKILAFSLSLILFSQVMFIPSASAVNGCGPESSSVGYSLTKFFLYPYDKRFEPACNIHDECYNLKVSGKTQAQCDAEFRQNLYKICDNRDIWQKLSEDVFGYITNPKLWGVGLSGPCKRQADYAVWAVSSFGSFAVSGAVQSVKVKQVKVKRIDDFIGDDEFTVCVTVQNDGNADTEWDLVLLKKDGSIADTEPDTYERNIAIGQQDTECVTTDYDPMISVSNLGNPATVVVRLDDYTGIAPFTPVANIKVQTNLKPYDKFNVVSFNQISRWEAYKGLQKIKSGK